MSARHEDSTGTVARALSPHRDGCTITVRVVPRAPRTAFAGCYGDALRLKIHAMPVDGAANAEVCRFIAEVCHVGANRIQLVMGPRSRDKVLLVSGLTAEDVESKIVQWLS